MNKTLTIFGACLLVAGSLTLNMIRYPVVWNMVGSPPVQSVPAPTQIAATSERTSFLPTTPPARQATPSPPQSDPVASFAIDRLPPAAVNEGVPPSDRMAFSGVERAPSGSLVAPVAPPPPNAVPLGRYESPPPTPAAAATAAAQAAAAPSVAIPTGRLWPAEKGQTSFARSSPALRPLGEATEPRRLQPVDPVSEPLTAAAGPQDDSLQRLPSVDFAVAPPVFDLNSPSPEGTVQIYPRAEGRQK